MDNTIEILRMIGNWVIYPGVIAWVTIKIAKFHFEKDVKTKYLLAKDTVANGIIDSCCGMLLNMWELANIKLWVSNGQMQANSPEVNQRRETALTNFHNFLQQSYKQLGQMGLYYGPELYDSIAQLQSEWNDMVNEDNFSEFEKWDEYRRKKIIPVLQQAHKELRDTVFDKIKSFRLYF